MAVKGQALVVPYTAWDTVNNTGKTGDAANHALTWTKDGVTAALSGSPVIREVGGGKYNVTVNAADCNADSGFLSGTSCTPGVTLICGWATFEPNTPRIIKAAEIGDAPQSISEAAIKGTFSERDS